MQNRRRLLAGAMGSASLLVAFASGAAALTAAGAVEGESSSATLAKAGDLDASFGSGGRVLTNVERAHVNSTEGISAVAIQPNGKIVVAGTTQFFNSSRNGVYFYYKSFQLARYNANGGLDPSFGSGGETRAPVYSKKDLSARAVAIQPNGKIVVAGFSDAGLTAQGYKHEFAVARYNANGSLDTHFGSRGYVLTQLGPLGGIGNALIIQSDGKIVVAGTAFKIGAGERHQFAVARYNANGSLDTRFGSKGKVLTDFSTGNSEGSAVAIQSDGKIVVAGTTIVSWSPSRSYFAVARYNTDGSLDAGFGRGGRAQAGFDPLQDSDEGTSVALQSDGKIVVAGAADLALLKGPDFALTRFNKNGSLDTGFTNGLNLQTGGGAAGLVRTDFGDTIAGIAIQADGKIVAAGVSDGEFALTRYNPDGSLDPDFGDSGYVLTEFGALPYTGGEIASCVTLQSDGKIVVAGYSSQPTIDKHGVRVTTREFAIARYLAP